MNSLTLLTWAPSNIWLQALLLVVSIRVVLWGADWLTGGAVALAERMGIPQIVIGLTVVAMGTSMPEFFVSLTSAIHGTPDLAVGNVVGSNIFNALFIVGVAAMVAPITILKDTVRKDTPFALIASTLLLLMCLDREINRLDALVMSVLFIFFMIVTIRGTHNGQPSGDEQAPAAGQKAGKSSLRAALLMGAGLLCLVLGSNVFVDNASAIAHSLGVSDAVIGLTIVACGTSLPELATSVVAARQGNSGIAIGNVLGSNVFNILMILGLTGLITPMTIQGITTTDLAVMVVSMMLLWLFSFTKYRVERWEGAVLVLAFAAYLTHLVSAAVA
jgi:cation:H+ antiporter